MCEITIRLDGARLRRLDQSIQAGTRIGTGRRIGKQLVLAPDYERLDRALGSVVVDRRLTMLDVARELRPLLARVGDRLAQQALRRYPNRWRFQA